MIKRQATTTLQELSRHFKAVAVIGPRQSGKTTLVRATFSGKPYVNLENPDMRNFAIEDPRGFLANYPDGAILDEIQRTPHLFSYLQQILDESKTNGQFILTGSNNFLLQENISQSLAGRVGYLFLLPLNMTEINISEPDSNSLMYKGGYPAIFDKETDPSVFYANYIRTYVERDVRLIKNISNLFAFERLLRLCAGRIGQLLNMNSLSIEVGVDVKTVQSWIGVMEAAFILFRLPPYHKSFNKRIVKMPKLYFYDTGLACALLGIENKNQLKTHPLRGSLFENLIITDLLKYRFNQGKLRNIFFWRNNTGHEVDVIVDRVQDQLAVEIKSGKTITKTFFSGITYWQKLSGSETGFVIYDGNELQKRSNGITVLPFHQAHKIMDI